MRYDVYFHNDMDGRVSAAVFLDFLKKQGDDIANFYPVDHWMAKNWDKMVRGSKNPTAIFDFYFHPRAKFFFDHHSTTFIKDEWRKKFKPTQYYHLNFKFKSCAGLVLDVLTKKFGYRASKKIRELVFWADVVDAAEYASAKETIELEKPGLKLDVFIEQASGGGDSLEWLIRMMSEKSVEEILKLKRVKVVLKKEREKIRRGVLYAQENLQVYDRVVFLDLTQSKVIRVRFAPHYLYPGVRYVITFMEDKGHFRISVGGNPWQKESSRIDLGRYLKSKYGGGGHRRAAGIAGIKSREQGFVIVKELIEFLQNK